MAKPLAVARLSRKVLITDRALRGLKPAPAGKRTVIWDSAVPGLCVRVTDKGAASFSVLRRVKGQAQPVRRTLGISWQVPFPAGVPLPYALATAREDARAMIVDMARGVDPREKKAAEQRAEAQRKANSFATVAEDFIVRHVRKLQSAKDNEATIRRELIARWGERPIAEISRQDIVSMVEEIAGRGHRVAARRTFAFTSRLFNWSVERGIVESSPCASVKLGTLIGSAEARQRVLHEGEIRSLWQATTGLGYPASPFIRMLLLTGQRLREVAEMSWPEIDLKQALWTIPPERMKGGAAHEVPLSQAAVDLLKALPRWQGPFVFSAGGGNRPISGFSALKYRLDAALGGKVAAWTFHDLRRSMRTGLGALPIPSNVCELCIAHAQPGLHRVYDRHSYREEKRRAFELWAARIAEIVEPGGSDKVVRLKVSA
jgi:integrase